MRSGRLTKWKGEVASFTPRAIELFSRARTGAARLVLLALLSGFAVSPAGADDRYWDANNTAIGSGGTGTWNTTDDVWSTNDDGVSGPYSAWDNGALDDAFFGGTAGTVTLVAPITVHNMTFQTNGYTVTGGTLTLDGTDPTISVTTGTSVIESVINSTSGLVKAGGGGLRLDGINTFNGGIDIDGGTLHLNAANNFVGDVNINSGRLIVNGDTGLGDVSNVINMASGTRLDAGATGGDLAGRTVSISGGTIVIAGAGVGSAFFTGDGGVTASNSVQMSNDTNDYTGRTTFSGSGASSFTSIGNLGEVSALGAPTTVADGTIFFGNSSQTNHTLSYVGDGDSSNRNWQINPGSGPFSPRPQLRNSGTGTLTLTGDIALGGGSSNGPQFYALTADLELLGVISSNNGRAVTFLADSGRTVTLGNASTFSGTAVIGGGTGGGTVQAGTIADIGVASSLGTGTNISIGGNDTLSYTGAGASSNRNWSINNGMLANDGTGALALSGDMTIANTATLGGSFTGADNVYSGVISGGGNLRSAGDATWVLDGANTYTGDTVVDSGVLRAGTADAFGGSTDFVVNGGTLDMNGFDRTLTTLSGAGGTVDLGSAILTLEAGSGTTASYAGSITGSGGLTKLGASTQTLTGASTYTGDTTIGGGTLNLDFSAAGAPPSDIIGSGSTLNMSGGTLNVIGADGAANTQTFDGLNITAGSNTIDASSGTGGDMTLNLGAINWTGGTMTFNLPDSGIITTSNADSFLGFATVNGTDYAKVEGGRVLPFEESDYSDKDNAANWLDGEFITDVDGFFGTVNGSVQLGGLRYTQPVSTTVNVTAGDTLGVNALIIVAPSVLNNDQLITGGTITGGPGGSLGVQQNSTGNFTIDSQIIDNTSATAFAKQGSGLVTLSNEDNTYTGPTLIAEGTLSVVNIADGGVPSSIGASNADSSNLIMQGGTLQYTGTGDTSDRGFTFTKSGDILGAGIEVTDPNANLTFSGLVTSPDDANFTKSGPGTLTLANPTNDYVGPTTVTGGLLSVNTLADGGAVSGIGASSADSANLVLNGGGLQYTGATTSIDRGFTLGPNDGTIDVNNAATTLTISGTAVGPGGTLTKEGNGTLVLSGTNTYNGGNTVNAGVLRAGSTQAFGAAATMTLANAAGVTLDLDGFDNTIGPLQGGGAGGGNVTLGSSTLRIAFGNGNYSGAISGTGGIWRTNGGTQTFNGCNNTYTGSTLLQGANVSTDCLQDGNLASGIGASSADSSNLQFITGALIYTGGSIAINRGFELVGGTGNIQVFDAATTLEFRGAAIGGGSLIKSGPGTLVLSGLNTYTGNTRVTDGVLRAAAANAFGPQGEMTLDNTAGVLLDLDGFDTVVSSLIGGGANGGNIDLGSATLTILDGVNRTYAGVISGTGNLVKSGTRIQRLSGCNSDYTGSTTINGGELEVNCLEDGGVNSSLGASTSDPANLVINGGTLDYIGSGGTTDRQLTLGTNGGTISSTGTGPIQFTNTGAVTLSGTDAARTLTLTGTNTDTNIFSAQLDDNGTGATSLTKTGDGLWRLTNANSTYTGVTTISGGILEVDQMADGGMASSIGAASSDAANLVIGNGSTLRYTGAGDTSNRQFTLDEGVTFIESSGTGALQFTNTGTVALTGTDTPRTIALGGTNTDDNTFGGAIGDNGTGATTLAKNDSGTWVLTGNNTFTGNTVINDGNLVIGNGGTTGNAGAGNVIVDSPTSTLSLNRSDTFTFDGTLSGPGTLAQIGSGTSVLTSADNAIGATTISNGTLQVDGGLETPTIAMTGSSTLTVGGTVQAAGPTQMAITGDAGDSTINIDAGGILRAAGDLGGGSDVVSVAGLLDAGAGTLALGADDDTLILNDGAVISGGGVEAGAGTDLLRINNAIALTLDGASVGGFESLEKLNTGVLTLTGNHTYTAGTTISAGTLQVGDGGTSGSLASDVLNNGALVFNRSDTVTFAGLITGSGTVEQIGSGTTILTGDNTYSGPTTVRSGILLINGDQSGATGLISVENGGTLGGTGIVGGDVTVADGGAISPGNTPGTLTINGALVLNEGSDLNYEFGQANVVGGALNDLTVVQGDLVLDGTLNVATTAGGSFDPGIYRVISYTGSLTDNELVVGTIPSSDFFVQTSIPGQVNLVNTAGFTFNYWDGNAGPKNDGAIDGGNGIWQNSSGNDNWTDISGTPNAPFTDAAFAIFMAAPGTVTVDGSLGDVEVAGMQFAVDGYVIEGDPITLVTSPSFPDGAVIRVGDSTAAGAGYTVTIRSVLTGDAALVKTDLGTLVLEADNTYTGGTAINGGTIQISSDTNLGAAGSPLSLDGGTLRVTADVVTDRDTTLGDMGGTFETPAGTLFTHAGTIHGTGSLTKSGDGTVVLTGTNTYGGGTTIVGGTLQLGDGGTTGSIVGDVTNDGILAFNRSDVVTFAGQIIGSGALVQQGPGTTILTGNNTYSGTTTISDGTLQLGDGGTSGSVVGDIVNNGTLVFNRADLMPVPGTISGSGDVVQEGTGTTVLLGTNSYTGTTHVTAGALFINGDQSAATGLTTVANGGTLGGIGVVGGDVTIADGGTLSPGDAGGAPGTLTVNGTLTLNGGSTLSYSFGQADVVGGPFNDLTVVQGDLVLDGTLNVTTTAGGSFDPGIYRVISYAGSLTDNELVVGTIPSPDFFVQTSIPGQVNLVNTAGFTFNYWDGNAGPKNDSAIDGGNGIWQNSSGNDNWTDIVGTPNAPFTDAAFAIFMAAPGTVTVDGSLGDVEVAGMQFAVDGYVIEGDPVTLVASPSFPDGAVIRVGDSTAAGAGYTVTIRSVLTGDAALVKTDLGTLVLEADNTYTGGTAINGGTIQISRDTKLGAAGSPLSLDGGTLRVTADVVTDRDTTLGGMGGTFETPAGTQLTHGGTIQGTGSLTKSGDGTVVLTGTNTYGGGTIIAGGTLQLGDGGTTGSIVGDVTNDGILAFNRSDSHTFGGLVSGTGSVRQIGTGTTILTAANSYSGITMVEAGTLQAGATDTFSPNSAVIVASGATLDLDGFDQTVAGLVNGGLVRTGGAPGTLLTIASPYIGAGGTLALNTYLGTDASPSDRLVIDGGTATGGTLVDITNVGGSGARTTGDGILVIDAANGATTAPAAFALAGPVVAGPYEYTLHRGDLSGEAPDDWFLRSTINCSLDPSSPACQDPPSPAAPPAYRAETSLYAAIPSVALDYGNALLDSLDERLGALRSFRRAGRAGSARNSPGRLAWGRFIGLTATRDGGELGIYGSDGPSYDYDLFAVQVGTDVYRREHSGGSFDNAGLYFAFGRTSAGVEHFDGTGAGTDTMSAVTVGAYWTHYGARGWYLDGVIQGTWYDIEASGRLPSLKTDGVGLGVSLEGGYPFRLGNGLVVELQGQLAYQTISVSTARDVGAEIRFDDVQSLVGRLGVRLSKTWMLGPPTDDGADRRRLVGWIRGSVVNEFLGQPKTLFSSEDGYVPFKVDKKGAGFQINAGIDAQLADGVSVYGSFDFLQRFDGNARAFGGELGLKLRF